MDCPICGTFLPLDLGADAANEHVSACLDGGQPAPAPVPPPPPHAGPLVGLPPLPPPPPQPPVRPPPPAAFADKLEGESWSAYFSRRAGVAPPPPPPHWLIGAPPRPRPPSPAAPGLQCPYDGTCPLVPRAGMRDHCITVHMDHCQDHACPLCPAADQQLEDGEERNLLAHMLSCHVVYEPPADYIPAVEEEFLDFDDSIYEALQKRLGTQVADSTLAVDLDQECLFCYETFSFGQQVSRMDCLCLFHSACLSSWFKSQNGRFCPLHRPGGEAGVCETPAGL
mmetsp:Transcript_17303/g.67300  ORF Transcript_17303/g.67300 Transcript_17303/m.67300 type:complete len:282 (-) Transcript_17303:59-904(-)